MGRHEKLLAGPSHIASGPRKAQLALSRLALWLPGAPSLRCRSLLTRLAHSNKTQHAPIIRPDVFLLRGGLIKYGR